MLYIKDQCTSHNIYALCAVLYISTSDHSDIGVDGVVGVWGARVNFFLIALFSMSCKLVFFETTF